MKRRKWTSEEELELRKMHAEGYSPKDISLKLNRTHDSILRKSDVLDLSFLVPDLQIDTRFAHFIIIKKVEIENKNPKMQGSTYFCLCDCGSKFELGRSSITTGNSISCGCARNSFRIRPPGQSASNRLFRCCKSNAERRSLDFLLTKEEHANIISQDCIYCGAKPLPYNPYLRKDGTVSNKQIKNMNMIERAWIVANTVDRMDNDKGYFLENCVPACWPCNKMRVDVPIVNFIAQVHKIAEFQSRKLNK